MVVALTILVDAEDADSAIGTPGLMLGGKYRLEEPIARGGMARVWRARHITLNRPVAVKFVEGAGEGQERIDRFLREAKVAASVRHKNVVDILDFGVFDGRESGNQAREAEPYMVMELLEGETLSDLIARGPVPLGEAVTIVLQLLGGLDAVHRAGIIHRDLKPGNVFLTHDQDGTFARLLDFGISQGAEEAEASTPLIVGTPEYMSPEQAMGAPLDARADLYSVGVILYEMLSGRVPFEHADGQQVLEMVVADTPTPVIKLRPDAPELCAVVDMAMSRSADARYGSAREMRRAVLEACGMAETTERTSIARDLRPSGTRRRDDVVTMPELEPAALAADVPSDPAFVAESLTAPQAPAPVTPATGSRRMIGALVGLGAALLIALAVIARQASTPPASPVAPTPPLATTPPVAAPSPSIAAPSIAAPSIAAPPVAVPGVPTVDEVAAAEADAGAVAEATRAEVADEAEPAPSRREASRREARLRAAASAVETTDVVTEPEAPAVVAPPRAVVTDLDF